MQLLLFTKVMANNSYGLRDGAGVGNNGTRRRRPSCFRCFGDLCNYLLRLRVSPEELEQRYKSREIDKFLEKDKHAFRRQVG